MTNQRPNHELLQRIIRESQARQEGIRRRMEWIEAHRRELWKRLDRVHSQTTRAPR